MRASFCHLLICALLASLAVAAPAVAAEPPVVILVMDEMSLGTMLNAGDKIDAQHFPAFASMTATATWYRNHTTVSDNTLSAVPSILTGQRPANGPSINIDESHNIFNMLKGRYRINGYEPLTELCSLALCPEPKEYSLLAGARIRGSDANHIRLRKLAAMIAGISRGGRRPLLWAVHTVFPHSPYAYLPNGDQYDDSRISYAGSFFGYDWLDTSHEGEIAMTQQRMLMQAQFADRILAALRSKLEKVGLWDKALVVVTADHGISFTPNHQRRSIGLANFAELASVPLLVKYPQQNTARVSKQSTHSIDILPTIAAITHSKPEYQGRTLISAPFDEAPIVRAGRKRTTVEMSLESMLTQQDAEVAQRQRRFPYQSLFVTASNHRWVGKQLSGLATVPGKASGRVLLDHPEYFKNPRPNSGWLPGAFLTARTRGISTGARIVIVAGGRVLGAATTFGFTESPESPVTTRLATMLDQSLISQSRIRLSFFLQSAAGLQRLSSN